MFRDRDPGFSVVAIVVLAFVVTMILCMCGLVVLGAFDDDDGFHQPRPAVTHTDSPHRTVTKTKTKPATHKAPTTKTTRKTLR